MIHLSSSFDRLTGLKIFYFFESDFKIPILISFVVLYFSSAYVWMNSFVTYNINAQGSFDNA